MEGGTAAIAQADNASLDPATSTPFSIEMYYSSATCGLKTKKDTQALRFLLESKRLDFEEYDVCIDQMRLKEMRSRSGDASLPQLFVNGVYAGGYDEVAQLEEEGRFDLIIKALLGELSSEDDDLDLEDIDISDEDVGSEGEGN